MSEHVICDWCEDELESEDLDARLTVWRRGLDFCSWRCLAEYSRSKATVKASLK